MKPKRADLKALLVIAGLLCAPALFAAPQGKTQPKDNPEVPGLLKTLKEVTKDKKGRRDHEGQSILDQLTSLHPKLNKKQQRNVEKGVERVLLKARRKPDNVGLLLAAGEGLSKFGKAGASSLAKVANDKKFSKKEWLDFRAQMVRLLGRPAELAYKDQLIKFAVTHKDEQINGAAGYALGYYSKHPQKVRKEIAGRLIKELDAIYNQARANLDANDPVRKTYEDRYAAIQDPWMKTLEKLTGQKLKDSLSWMRWFNNNKRKNWDRARSPKK